MDAEGADTRALAGALGPLVFQCVSPVAASCAVPRDTGKSGMLVTSAPAAVTVACPGSRGEAWTHHKCSQKGRAYKKVRRLLCIVTVVILIYIVACLSIFYNENVLLQREIKCFVFKKVLELKKS